MASTPVRLSEYRPPAWLVDHVDLRFDLGFELTEVTAELRLRRDPAQAERRLRLDGEDLELLSIALDDRELGADEYQLDARGLSLDIDADTARLRTRVRLRPEANTALEGLYRSGEFLVTQCEAEGFRHITFFPDRPDVMTRFRVELVADRARFPVLLGNGNPGARGELPDGRHFAVWDDPHPKPCYLFALVAGRLEHIEDRFRTSEGRDVTLRIYAEADAIDRCAHAMDSLKRAMRWDEEVYGRAYDLDVYNIVATHDFNMGAMENKGLNIFNAKYIVADGDTATDDDFGHVEAVVAHEYFHNWTGNRVTCRDWFQLSLKEGLTVFRDQCFSADMGSAAVKRIDDVRQLRAVQFAEDAGPFAHPVRPDSYVEINNFYTATVYEKGAEIVRMLHTTLGAERFRRGTDLYFARHDGQAVTCDDFRRALAEANGVDLDPYARWYEQAGTPRLEVNEDYDATNHRFTLRWRQRTPPTPGQSDKRPVPIPVRMMLYGPDGSALPLRLSGEAESARTQRVFVLREEQGDLVFEDIRAKPIASLLQEFSAPVELQQGHGNAELAFLARHDHDPFNRWQAVQSLAIAAIADEVTEASAVPRDLLDAARVLLGDATLDPAFVAECLLLPEEAYLADRLRVDDPYRLHYARRRVAARLGRELGGVLRDRYALLAQDDGTARDGRAAARRRLKNTCLSLLLAGDANGHAELARTQFARARNMTDRLSALTRLVHERLDGASEALAQYHARFANDPLAVNKWLALQASSPHADTLERVRGLLAHEAFNWRNPNKVRSLFDAFGRANRIAFHAPDGAGYRFMAEAVSRVDELNPQTAARLVAAFNAWRRVEPARGALMRAALQGLADKPGLSRDVSEIVARALA